MAKNQKNTEGFECNITHSCPHVENENQLKKDLDIERKNIQNLQDKIKELEIEIENNNDNINDTLIKLKVEEVERQKNSEIRNLRKKEEENIKEIVVLQERNNSLIKELEDKKDKYECDLELQKLIAQVNDKKKTLEYLMLRCHETEIETKTWHRKLTSIKEEHDSLVDRYNLLLFEIKQVRKEREDIRDEAFKINMILNKRKEKINLIKNEDNNKKRFFFCKHKK